jgi:hypothetical protein
MKRQDSRTFSGVLLELLRARAQKKAAVWAVVQERAARVEIWIAKREKLSGAAAMASVTVPRPLISVPRIVRNEMADCCCLAPSFKLW